MTLSELPLWLSNLLFWSAQIAVLVLAAGFLPRLFQIRQPRILLAYWRTLLAGSLLIPFIEPWRRAQSAPAIAIAPAIDGTRFAPASAPAVSYWHLPNFQIIAEIIGVVILAGIATRFLILALGLLKLRQFRRTSSQLSSQVDHVECAAALEQMRADLRTDAEFRLSSDVNSPVTFGFSAPVILLPENFPSMNARFQSAIACHELLHVRRNDWVHHLAEEIIRDAMWFHPAIAWLIVRVRLAREQVVDQEVVRLTKSPKPYVEALLEFTNGRTEAIPAPPFLAERQLAEPVALMLKEVRMSRARMISSLTVMVCALVLAGTIAVWTFPLKAAPSSAQNVPKNGIAAGVTDGITGGVRGGVKAAVSRGVADGLAGKSQATIDKSTIWTDSVKKGAMPLQVRGAGTLVHANDSTNLVARVMLPENMTSDVKLNQSASVDTLKGVLSGHVIRLSQEVLSGMRGVDIALDSALPPGASPSAKVNALIDVGKLDNVLYVGRPVFTESNSESYLFKIVDNGKEAVRTKVKFGRVSVNTVEVFDGLNAGDAVILSDMSAYDNVNRIQIK